MKVSIDGIAGSGKTTLAASLRAQGFDVVEDGVLSVLVDGIQAELPEDMVFLVLDATPLTAMTRLRLADADMRSPEHQFTALCYYRLQYRQIGRLIGASIINAELPAEDVVAAALRFVQLAEELAKWTEAGIPLDEDVMAPLEPLMEAV